MFVFGKKTLAATKTSNNDRAKLNKEDILTTESEIIQRMNRNGPRALAFNRVVARCESIPIAVVKATSDSTRSATPSITCTFRPVLHLVLTARHSDVLCLALSNIPTRRVHVPSEEFDF